MRERSKNAIKVMSWCWPDDPRAEQKVICKLNRELLNLEKETTKSLFL